MNIVLMGLIFIYSVYKLFVKGFNKDELEDVHPKSLSNLVRYLLFGAINLFFAGRIFEIDWLNWISLYSIMGIILCSKSIKGEKELTKKFIFAFVLLILFSIYRVPTHPASFENYINSKEMYQCVKGIECVKITPEITNHGALKAKVEIFSVKEDTFDWYFLFAKASLQLADDNGKVEKLKGINILGYWIEY